MTVNFFCSLEILCKIFSESETIEDKVKKSWFEILDKLGFFIGSDGSAVDQLDQWTNFLFSLWNDKKPFLNSFQSQDLHRWNKKILAPPKQLVKCTCACVFQEFKTKNKWHFYYLIYFSNGPRKGIKFWTNFVADIWLRVRTMWSRNT